MHDTLIKVVPLFFASTLSPGILALSLAIISKKQYSKERIIALLLGSILVVAILVFLAINLTKNISSYLNHKNLINIIDIVLAVTFLYFALYEILNKESERKFNLLNNNKLNFTKWLLAGFIISATNFDAVMLNFTANREIYSSYINYVDKIILFIIGIIFFVFPILIPFLIYLMVPKLTNMILQPVNIFLTKYSRYIIALIFLFFSIYLFYRAI